MQKLPQAIPAVQKARLAILDRMTPSTRQMTTDIESLITAEAVDYIELCHKIGVMIRLAMEAEGEYGSRAVKLIADYIGIDKTRLYQYRLMADAFDLPTLQNYVARAMSNGGHLTVSHLTQVAALKCKKTRLAWLNRIVNESMSVRQLAGHLSTLIEGDRHRGGRKPQIPASPLSGLQRLYSMAQQFINLEPVLVESVFKRIDQLPSDHVNENLLARLTEAREQVVAQIKAGGDALKRLDLNIERVGRILATQAERASQNDEAEDDESAADEAVYDDEPMDDEPVDDEPVDDEFPNSDEPADDEPADDEPADDESADDESAADDEFPLNDEPKPSRAKTPRRKAK